MTQILIFFFKQFSNAHSVGTIGTLDNQFAIERIADATIQRK